MHFHLFLVSGKIVCSASSWTGDSSMECEKYSCRCHKNIHNNHNNSNIQVFYVCSSDFSSLLCMCVRFSVFHSMCFGMFHIFHVRTRWSEHSGCIVISLSRHATHNTISIYLFMSSFFVYHYQINIEIFHISSYQVAIFHLSWAPLLARLISGCKAQHHFIFVLIKISSYLCDECWIDTKDTIGCYSQTIATYPIRLNLNTLANPIGTHCEWGKW